MSRAPEVDRLSKLHPRLAIEFRNVLISLFSPANSD